MRGQDFFTIKFRPRSQCQQACANLCNRLLDTTRWYLFNSLRTWVPFWSGATAWLVVMMRQLAPSAINQSDVGELAQQHHISKINDRLVALRFVDASRENSVLRAVIRQADSPTGVWWVFASQAALRKGDISHYSSPFRCCANRILPWGSGHLGKPKCCTLGRRECTFAT